MTDDRTFAPDARYAANTVTGIRWYDERTGQEQWSRSVGVDTLLAAGAEIDDAEAVRIPCRVKITPHKGKDGWSAKITRKQLDSRHEKDGVVELLGTRSYVESQAFEQRDEAVAWVESEVDPYAEADIRDAVEWREQRHSDEDAEEDTDGTDQSEQAELVTDGGVRPRRDISARTAIGDCEYCGGNANSLLGGEHIWKCSEIVPKAAIEQFIDDLRHNSERRSFASFDGQTADEIADELEALVA